MHINELTSLIEKAVGQALTPEHIKTIVDPIVLAYLQNDNMKKGMVMTGDQFAEINGNQKKKFTFSQFMGDLLRDAKREPMRFCKGEDLTRLLTSADALHLSGAQGKLLYEGADASGGYLVPTEEGRTLLDLTTNFEVVPQLCTQVPMRTNSIVFPTLTAGLTAYWIPEASTSSPTTQATGLKVESTPTFSQMTITAHVLAIYVFVSNQLLDDSDPGVDQILFNLFAKTLGAYFDIACLRGAGTATDPVSGLDTIVSTNIMTVGQIVSFSDVLKGIYACYNNADQATQEIQVIGNTRSELALLEVQDNNGKYIFKGPADSVRGIPSLWTEPWYRDNNILNTYGATTDKTRVYCGDFRNYAYVGTRSQINIRANPWGAGFPNNQTAFLAEFRKGFTVDTGAEDRFSHITGFPTT